MFSKMFSKISLIAIVFIFAMCMSFGMANAVELTDGVETGMSISKVSKKIDLEHSMSDRGLDSYHRKGTASWYFFTAHDGKLIYKIILQRDGKQDKIINMMKQKCGDPEVVDGTYFFDCGNDLGYKVGDCPEEIAEDAFQIWYGSIKLWNDYAASKPQQREFVR